MNGQTQNSDRYEESLRNTPGPVNLDDLPKIKMDLAGLSHYAAKKGVHVSDLSEEERARFLNLK